MATSTASTSAAALFAKVPARDPDQMLAFLTDGVDYIMTRLEEGLSLAAHTNLQTTVYNYCTSIGVRGRLVGHRSACFSSFFFLGARH
jgi:cullin 1